MDYFPAFFRANEYRGIEILKMVYERGEGLLRGRRKMKLILE